ncbi:MAG: Crp/Fnr family transcriptional regulator [Bradyrhizobium sp.]|uniref:Crp/Fnr family transcriptional regulator n=1 Tax=Bradyrhizobium sp. TaxID=376 RepID=UPI001EC192DD|nr:Crp/Fnr family transcriptional regulator [Bradyrhizobium sp.]MBU6458404.1 Crp/Fnr family transcriptional regulator [Bradyrhizobium sp.]MDE2601337.1 Crp/Fnr family transcriptional regulator [Bradyrhizobium sp.]
MSASLATALLTKLMLSNHLDGADVQAIQRLPIRTQDVKARHVIVADGDRSTECSLLVEGFAFRSKTTPDGERQTVSMHIPGEIPDLQSLHLNVMDHDLIALTPCVIGFISHGSLKALNIERPNIAAALWRTTLIDAAILREWIVNVGRRSATARTAHLLLALHHRLRAIGMAQDGEFGLPVTQTDLADCLGLSAVHVNRVLQLLRAEGLLTVSRLPSGRRRARSEFHLLQQEKLEELAGFDPAYLHQQPES